MASRVSRSASRETVTPAPSEFEANLPEQTRIVTAEGVRSARIRNNALRTASVPLQPTPPVTPKQKGNAKGKSKLKSVVILGGDEGRGEKPMKRVRVVAPTSVRTSVTPKQLGNIKRGPVSSSPTGNGGHQRTSVTSPPPRNSDAVKYPGIIVEANPVADTQGRLIGPGQSPQRIPIVTTQTGPPRPVLSALPGPSRLRQSHNSMTSFTRGLTGYEENPEDEQYIRQPSPARSDASYEPNENEGNEEDEDEVGPLNELDLDGLDNDLNLPEARPRNPNHRSSTPEPEMEPEVSIMETIEDDNEYLTASPEEAVDKTYRQTEFWLAQRDTGRTPRHDTPLYPPIADPTGRGKSGRVLRSPISFDVRQHDIISTDSLDSSSFDLTYLASKKAFWWAHIIWIAICFAITLLLWTLGLSLYWGNRFATVGPPAPCDMTASVRPFPQTYEESFKIFRRPDVSWDPVVRQQMEDFGNYIGADPWLMDNCILPRNVIKLPLVTCQERLPWYNLTETQVMWLNENSGWGYNLDWDLTEEFNEIFDMQFELQELQTSWMLSDHGPTSPDYGTRRCQACNDMRAREEEESEQMAHWPSKGRWNLSPHEQAVLNRLTSSKAFHQLKKAFGVKDNPQVSLINEADMDIPYYEKPPYVGSDMVLTDTDTSTWQPATSESIAIRGGRWR